MAQKSKTITVKDFVPRAFHILPALDAQGADTWVIKVHGDEVDAQNNVVTPDLDVAVDIANVNAWNNFLAQVSKQAKVKRGVDDGT